MAETSAPVREAHTATSHRGVHFGELLVRIRLDTLEKLLADLEPPDGEPVPTAPGTRRARTMRSKEKR